MTALINPFHQMPTIAVEPDHFQILHSAQSFRESLISHIQRAQQRIYIAALYLEDDEAGQQILHALFKAKQRNPALDISICVDWHRAQRGLIGANTSEGNAAFYQSIAAEYQHKVPIYGVPVRGREVFGVLHLKGFIIDDKVLYSGASLNNIYLHVGEKYRFDRYHVIDNKPLADSMATYIRTQLISHPAVNNLCDINKPETKEIKADIRQLRSSLAQSKYHFKHQAVDHQHIAVTPLVGVGKRRNRLNQKISQLIAAATTEIFICTPYFNFPKGIAKQVKRALKRGVKVSIVVGDKTANDFYIPPDKPFKTIAGLPYLYELNLRRFAKINEANMANRNLSIHLWKHDHNSFHLKGIWVDQKYALLTGNNLNPRAWSLDLENALLIQDDSQLLKEKLAKERESILLHSQRVGSYRQLEKIDSYPVEVQKLLKNITRVRVDRILKKIL